jgi:hypothetical protein
MKLLDAAELTAALRMRASGASVPEIAECYHVPIKDMERMLFHPMMRSPLVELDGEVGTDPVSEDERFIAAMKRAIAAGKENAPIGIDTRPCTRAPIVMTREFAGAISGSPAAQCMDGE